MIRFINRALSSGFYIVFLFWQQVPVGIEHYTGVDHDGCAIPDGYAGFSVGPKSPYQTYQVRVRSGKITWNGSDIEAAELTSYANDLADRPGRNIQFETTGEVPCSDRTLVRKALAASTLCQQGGCWESNYQIVAPIMY